MSWTPRPLRWTCRHGVCRVMGVRSWKPRRRPRKVDCTGDSTASDVAVVMALLFGHMDDEERAAGDPGVGDASAVSAPRSCSGSLTRGHWTV
jgi:hypothetical protein